MAAYSWNIAGTGAWTTAANWSPNTNYPQFGDTATISTVATTAATMSFANGFNWPASVELIEQRVWTFGAAAGTISMALQANSTIYVAASGVANAQFDLLVYPKFTGNYVLTKTGLGVMAVRDSAAVPAAWTISKLVILEGGYGGVAANAMPIGNTIEFGNSANPGSVGDLIFDSATGTTAATIPASFKFYNTRVNVQYTSTAAVTFTGNLYFSSPTAGVSLLMVTAGGCTLNGVITGDGATELIQDGGSAGRLTFGTSASIATGQITAVRQGLAGGMTFQSGSFQNTAWGPNEAGTLATYPAGAVVGALTGSGTLVVVRNLTIGSSANLSGSHSGPINDNGSSSTATLTKAGTGTQTLSGSSSTLNAWVINAGILAINSTSGLGASAASASVTVSNTGPATLRIGAAVNKTSSQLTIGGTGVLVDGSAQGALHSVSGTTSYTCASVVLSASTTVRVDAGTFTLTSAGAISGSSFSITKTGAGELVLNQTADSSYTGGTIITDGTVTVRKSVPAAGGNSILGTNVVTLGSSTSATAVTTTFKMSPTAGGQTTTYARNTTLTAASGVNATHRFETANTTTLTISSAVALTFTGGGTTTRTIELTGSATGVWDTNLTAPGGSYTVGLSKTGSGTWTLNNRTYTFTGGIAVTAGTLTASSVTYTASTITVNGGTLNGTISSAGALALSSGIISTTSCTATTFTVTGGSVTGTLTATTINASAGTFNASDCTGVTAFNITGGSHANTTSKYRGVVNINVAASLTFNGQILNPTSGPTTTLNLTSTGGAVILINANTASDYNGDTVITADSIVRGQTPQNPATAGQGYVFGQSKVIVEGTLRTSANATSLGRIRYKGGLTLKTGSTLAIGIN